MKLKRLFCTALLALLTLMMTVPAILGQEDVETNSRKIPRYKLVDLGTFGGRASYVNPPWSLGAHYQMNRHGVTVGSAATSVPSSFGCPFCNGLDGQVFNVFHAFKWSGGVLKDLGALPGELTNSVATSINAEGSVVGHSENGKIDPLTGTRELRAFLWRDGKIRSLGTFGGNHSFVGDINDHGQIVGYALNTTPDPFSWIGVFLECPDTLPSCTSNSTQTRAFLWENGHKRDLGTLGGPDAVAGSVNERGEVIGVSYTNSTPNLTTGRPTVAAFLWRRGKMIDLGNFGGRFTGITQINNRGQVIGTSNLPGDEFWDPYLWEDGKLIDLYTSSVGGNPYTVNAINDAGQLVGAGAFGDHPYDAYLLERGVANDLGFLEGDCYSEAIVIGSKGQIAGESYPCTLDSQRPFIWQDGTMYDLNDVIQAPSGFRFTQAFVINDRGEIGGIGTPPGCDFDEDCGHAMVLIPCSEGFHEPDCEGESETAAVRGVAALPKQNTASAADRVIPSRDLAARIQAKYRRNEGFFNPRRK
jgi:probable HAF family extracellular repeat protein